MKIEVFDTTLRDGTQSEGISLSVKDKLRIAHSLDEFGIDIIEGGWPGSNPKDEAFFEAAKTMQLRHARLCAFGMTARKPDAIDDDPNLLALLATETPVVCIVGKTWQFHSQKGLRLDDAANAAIIAGSIEFLKKADVEVIFDAEHFFDGYRDNPEFTLDMIRAAADAGADTIVLCDTNGGSLPADIARIVTHARENIAVPLGIHAHNDGELAVANTIAAVESGAVQVQGTINGVGERCGNANLCSVLPNLLLKRGMETGGHIDLARLVDLSRTVSEIMNLAPQPQQAFVGTSAFTHKAGLHVNAVMKDARMYEHITPETVGGTRRVLVSDLAGRSNILFKAREVGVDLEKSGNGVDPLELLQWIKSLEYEGYQFDGAEASFELLLRQRTGEFSPYFQLIESHVYVHHGKEQNLTAETTLKIEVGDEIEHTVAEGVGPVNAMDLALRRGLARFYPEIANVRLSDYKVRVLDAKDGTSAKVRVLVETTDGHETWSTVGVSENIIEASWQAISDSLNYQLFRVRNKVDKPQEKAEFATAN